MRGILTAICAALLVSAPLVVEAHGIQGPPPPQGFGGPGPGGRGGGQRRGGFDQKILDSLNLTAAQKAKVKKLKDAQRARMMKMMGGMRPGGPPPRGPGGPGGRPPMDPKMRKMMEKNRAIYTAGLKKVLTHSQWLKYDAAVKKAMSQRRARGGGPGAPGGPGPRGA